MPYALVGVFSNEPSDSQKSVIYTYLLLTPVCWREFQQGLGDYYFAECPKLKADSRQLNNPFSRYIIPLHIP